MADSFLVLEYFELEKYCRMDPEYRSLWVDIWRRQLRRSRRLKARRSPKPLQHRKMLKAIHDIYARDETFIDHVAHDLDDGAVWFNDAEFARWHDLDGTKILSIFTADTRGQSVNISVNGDQAPELLRRNSGVLYCRAQNITGGWNAGASLRLDGRLYTVGEARLIQDQVWRVELEAKDR